MPNLLVNSAPCWMRILEIHLYSKLLPEKIIYGGDGDQLRIKVTGVKKLALAEDNGTVEISNLSYEDIIKIIQGEFYKIEIWTGYKTTGKYLLFSGDVAYISNKISARRDYTAYLIYGSEFVAQFTQARMNFSFNSSINLYSAYKTILNKIGVKNASLPEEAKTLFIHTAEAGFNTAKNIIEQVNTSVGSFDITTDTSLFGSVIDVNGLSNKRQIMIDPNTIVFENGNPTLNSTGLNIQILPTFDFIPSDIIIIDNSIIDISETNLDSARTNFKSNYLDTSFKNIEGQQNQGAYMIRQIDYTLENRGKTFSLNILGKAISLIENIIGE